MLDQDPALLDLGACLAAAYERTAADDEVDYRRPPPAPPLSRSDRTWIGQVLRGRGRRRGRRER